MGICESGTRHPHQQSVLVAESRSRGAVMHTRGSQHQQLHWPARIELDGPESADVALTGGFSNDLPAAPNGVSGG